MSNQSHGCRVEDVRDDGRPLDPDTYLDILHDVVHGQADITPGIAVNLMILIARLVRREGRHDANA